MFLLTWNWNAMNGAKPHSHDGRASPDAVVLIENFRRLRQKNSVIHGQLEVLRAKPLMPKVAFPIHLTCQNRQDLNKWLAKDLYLKHEGESVKGAEKIPPFVHCGFQNGLQ